MQNTELIPVKVKKYYQLPNPTKLNNLQVLKKKINASGESNPPTFTTHYHELTKCLNRLDLIIRLGHITGKNGQPDHFGPLLVDQVNALVF